MAFKQITIIGTGLIGGSMGMALKAAGFAGSIVGCDRQGVLDRARAMRAIDLGTEDPVEAIQGSDLIVLATPVGAIIDLIERIGPLASPNALITDAGSTKREIVERARSVFGENAASRFIGGHPMAGKEHSGLENAESRLFTNAVWLLTPYGGQEIDKGKIKEYRDLLEGIGARIIRMEPDRHDRLCAWISHLPQMISTAVAGALVEEFGANPDVHAIGGRALREMTRIASSPYSMWRDIAYTNAANIEHAMHQLEQRLAHIRENLKSPLLREEFDRGNKFEIASKDVAATVLVVPGWQNSGPRHWQTLWEQQNPIFLRVQQRDWEHPHRSWWMERISDEVKQAPAPIVFAAHSLGCIAVSHWSQTAPAELAGKVKGALLVAPADVDRKDAPVQIKDFHPVPKKPLPFPSIVVASNNDPFLTPERAREIARTWGSRFVDIGPTGHVNGDSGLGDWPEGKRLLRLLIEGE
ncbi:MAG TPA: prephenate dehydrogenase/arogenate dehydrogenase family protein [Candidatus Angelobacter sp.]|nr:prephenate dehydrogenase/arogenate dehydrogenase family protein [Candidatus Angelobacter sp.]